MDHQKHRFRYYIKLRNLLAILWNKIRIAFCISFVMTLLLYLRKRQKRISGLKNIAAAYSAECLNITPFKHESLSAVNIPIVIDAVGRPIYMHLIARAEHLAFIDTIKDYVMTNYGKPCIEDL